jgi:phycocyanobilin lyase subunit beta
MSVTESPAIPSLITAVEQADTPDRLIEAVQALAAARSESGIPTLIAALGYNNPAAASIAMRGLIQMGELAVAPLLTLLDDYNYGARAWAIRALAAIADPRALDELLAAAATDFAPSVRRAATKGIGILRWFQMPSEQAQAVQPRALETLLSISKDADWSIRYAAVVGLQAFATALVQPHLGTLILSRLQEMADTETDLAVKARCQWAIASLANHPAAPDGQKSLSMHTPR